MRWIIALITVLLVSSFVAEAAPGVLPQTNLQITPKVGSLKSTFTIDASNSADTIGQGPPLLYSYKVNRKGKATPFIQQSSFSFPAPHDLGSHRAEVWTMDQNGRVSHSFIDYKVRETTGRAIRIDAEPKYVPAGEEVTLKVVIMARADELGDAEVRWDFDSNGAWETDWQKSRFATTYYDLVGFVEPTVEVRFPDGEHLIERGILDIHERPRSEEDYLRYNDIYVTDPEILAPVIDVSPGYKAKDTSTVFTFDAGQSRIPPWAWLEWAFDGEQFKEFDVIVKKQFETPGVHDVRVKACVNRENPKCALSEFQVEVPERSQGFTVTMGAYNLTSYSRQFYNQHNAYVEAITGDNIRFYAQITQHDQVAKLEHRWDFEGDGTWDTPFGAHINQEHIYDRPGRYEPRVEVRKIRDIEQDVVQSDTMVVEILDNTDPQGWIDFGAEKICYVGDTITATAKVYDQESSSSELKVRWDFENDGIWDTKLSTNKAHQHTLKETGKQSMRIQIVDPGGKSVFVRKSFVVEPSPAVKAAVDVSSRVGYVGQPMTFDAGRSEGHNLGYRWKVFGEPDDYGQSGEKISRVFRYEGKKEITLTVVDQLGNSDRVSFSVDIRKKPVIQTTSTPVVTPGQKPSTGGLFIPLHTDFDLLNVYE